MATHRARREGEHGGHRIAHGLPLGLVPQRRELHHQLHQRTAVLASVHARAAGPQHALRNNDDGTCPTWAGARRRQRRPAARPGCLGWRARCQCGCGCVQSPRTPAPPPPPCWPAAAVCSASQWARKPQARPTGCPTAGGLLEAHRWSSVRRGDACTQWQARTAASTQARSAASHSSATAGTDAARTAAPVFADIPAA